MRKVCVLIALSLLCGACTTEKTLIQPQKVSVSEDYPEQGTPSLAYGIEDLLLPTQPGQRVYQDHGILIDYSNNAFGYVSILAPENTQRQKAQVLFGDQIYTYDLVPNEYVIIPLQLGEGSYTLRTLVQVKDTQYSITSSLNLEVTLADENSPYLYPNQMVNYDANTKAILKSFELTQESTSDLRRVYEIYTYITQTIDYDYEKAEVAKTTFILPIIDETYLSEKGICFDYAALMTAMLRAQHIPTRIITGVTDVGYHAWVEVYLKDQGWINPSLYFATEEWKRVDPTFDSMGEYTGTYADENRY